MKATKKKAAAAPPSDLSDDGVLTLRYQLAELPSAQHRAGLCGLVLMVRWLARIPGVQTGVCELRDLREEGVTLRIDQPGLVRLFDQLYAADSVEIESAQLRKKRSGEVDPPRREVEKEVIDEKGKTRKKKVYIYPSTVPKGGLIIDMDPQQDGRSRWVKLWRDMIWSILRGVPATRTPFESRAAQEETTDAQETWEDLLKPPEHSLELPSTYYLGAQSTTAENVPFRDRARFQFLLHFWPYAAQIYVPAVLTKPLENRREFVGYALVIPDVTQLQTFCDELPIMLRNRLPDPDGFRPKESIVVLALESALDMARRLRSRLVERAGGQATMDLVAGYEVLHVNKEGNNVRLLSASRIAPAEGMVDAYEQCGELRDLVFRRQVLVNLLAGRPWHRGFDRLAQELPADKQFIGSEWFRRDARRMFDIKKHEAEMAQEEASEESGAAVLEGLIYRVVQTYVLSRLQSKHKLTWDKEKMKEGSQARADYNEKKQKIAKDAFLAVRSRAGQDFVDYFSGTICSVKHVLSPDEFKLLASALSGADRPDGEARVADLRTLTLLALSAHG